MKPHLLATALAAFALPACSPKSSGQQAVVVVGQGDDGGEGEGGVDAAPEQAHVDRAGHPLVTVLLVPGTLQDQYNAEATFAPTFPRLLQDALESRLVELDTIALGDGGPDPVDWPVPEGGTHPLLPVFTTDALLVDTGKACSSGDGGFAASYLDIEREIYLDGSTHTTCGGRTPNEAVVDETLTLVITNGRAPVTQGVPGPTRPATTSFPYLAEPN